ncbi:MAG: winged helix-turn-helix domain-containing protein [Leclercia sp.]
MRYHINARIIYDASDGTLTLPGGSEPDSQLSITASALLYFMLRNTGVVSRDEILKKVWDDNGLTSSNSNLNQYLSMLRKTFRHYDIDNVIVTVSRGLLQLNPELSIEMVDASSPVIPDSEPTPDPLPAVVGQETSAPVLRSHGACWYIAGAGMLLVALLLTILSVVGESESRPITLTPMRHSQCELLASDDMLRSVAGSTWAHNFEAVRQRLKLQCKPGERFVFFYGDRLETNGLGRVFLANCAMHEDNPFSYCDNYFYYSWKPQ